MNSKNQKIEEVMNSLDGIQKAEPNPFLYSKILNKISEKANEYTPMKIVWLAAASFALLLLLNWQALRSNHTGSKTNDKSTVEELANQYQLLNTNPINYN